MWAVGQFSESQPGPFPFVPQTTYRLEPVSAPVTWITIEATGDRPSNRRYQLALQILESLALGFRIGEQHHHELNDGHDGEEDKGRTSSKSRCKHRQSHGDARGHDPVAGVDYARD